jgi:hypothetical protein
VTLDLALYWGGKLQMGSWSELKICVHDDVCHDHERDDNALWLKSFGDFGGQ